MAKVIGQDIPSKFYDQYTSILTPAHDNKITPYRKVIKAPCRFSPRQQTSALQLKVRLAFKDSAACWHNQKGEDDWVPYQNGFRPYLWWLSQALAARRYPYQHYMHSTIGLFYRDRPVPWCVELEEGDSTICNYDPDDNYGDLHFLYAESLYYGEVCRFLMFRGPGDSGKPYLNIYCVGRWFGYPEANRLQAWSTDPDEFEEMEVTWNNQPSMVSLLDQQILEYGSMFYKFNVGAANSILFKIIEEYNPYVEDIGAVTFA
ncbi:unnamed protein product, partial [marine sediment metagenome]